MKASDCIVALELARKALDKHYRATDAAHDGKFNELGVEARKRVSQMIWILSEIDRYLTISDEAQRPQRDLGALLEAGQITTDEWAERMRAPQMREAMRPLIQVGEPLETLCEAFYWIAFRARHVIRLLPAMAKFEAEGVRNTRNKLVEHSEAGDSGIVMSSFGWGAPQGPVLKAVRRSNQADKWPDNGLFINASEFAAALTEKAEQAVVAMQM